jgi:predicted transcriptional regulator
MLFEARGIEKKKRRMKEEGRVAYIYTAQIDMYSTDVCCAAALQYTYRDLSE